MNQISRVEIFRIRARRQPVNDGKADVLLELDAEKDKAAPRKRPDVQPADARTITTLEACIIDLRSLLAKAEAARAGAREGPGALRAAGLHDLRKTAGRPPTRLAGAYRRHYGYGQWPKADHTLHTETLTHLQEQDGFRIRQESDTRQRKDTRYRCAAYPRPARERSAARHMPIGLGLCLSGIGQENPAA
jgi:hypothetical protein